MIRGAVAMHAQSGTVIIAKVVRTTIGSARGWDDHSAVRYATCTGGPSSGLTLGR